MESAGYRLRQRHLESEASDDLHRRAKSRFRTIPDLRPPATGREEQDVVRVAYQRATFRKDGPGENAVVGDISEERSENHLWSTPQKTLAVSVVPSGFSYEIFLSERKDPINDAR